MYIEGRKVLIKSLFGSHNYNLNTESSDKDYKVFLMPIFEDLYSREMFNLSVVSNVEDFAAYDIRRLPALLYKTSANFLEVLYSTEIYTIEDDGYKLLNKIFELKYDIARMNLKSLFGTSKKMYFDEMKGLEKATAGTKHLVDAYGYDTKKAVHTLRIMDFIKRFYDTNYSDFKKAMIYENSEREYFLSVKRGLYTLEEFKEIAEKEFINFMKLEPEYCKHDTNNELNKYITEIIRQMVFQNKKDCLGTNYKIKAEN